MKPTTVVILIVCAFVVGFVAGRGFREPAPATAQPAVSATAKLEVPSGQAAVGFLDMVDDKPTYQVAAGGTLNMSGWAACADAVSPISKLQSLIENKPAGSATVSFSRPDVAKAYGRPDFDRSGWKATVPMRGIAPGNHQIAARAICANGANTLLPMFQLVVTGGAR
jgi:hypothetical protein